MLILIDMFNMCLKNANSPKVVVIVLFCFSLALTLPALSSRAKFTLRSGQFGEGKSSACSAMMEKEASKSPHLICMFTQP